MQVKVKWNCSKRDTTSALRTASGQSLSASRQGSSSDFGQGQGTTARVIDHPSTFGGGSAGDFISISTATYEPNITNNHSKVLHPAASSHILHCAFPSPKVLTTYSELLPLAGSTFLRCFLTSRLRLWIGYAHHDFRTMCGGGELAHLHSLGRHLPHKPALNDTR